MMIETGRDNGPWAAGGRPTVRGIDSSDESVIAVNAPFGMTHGGPGILRWKKATATITLADVAVRNMPDTTNAEVLAALATIAGGENVGLRIDC
jgi:hypothetical protein